MIVDQETELKQETLQKEEESLMVAENKNFEQNKDNVLFQPTRAVEEIDTTANMEPDRDYETNVDPTHLAANKIRCCLCGVLMLPNGSNTCLQCLKA